MNPPPCSSTPAAPLRPKAAVLRHRNLTSYVIGTVEFGGADPSEAALVSVPPYHVAGLANLLSNLYLGRRIVYLRQFDAADWVATVRREGITHAMVVPTMLARICDVVEADGEGLPSLRALSYGGARTPATVLARTMARFPDVDLTNAYGLTETSSTIAVLGPEDHRAAPQRRPGGRGPAHLGRPGPTHRRDRGARGGQAARHRSDRRDLGPGRAGVGRVPRGGAPLDDQGWFPTRDRGHVDEDGYLFIEGRSDDTIVRGGENIAPAEIEEVLLTHPDIDQCAVVGVPDDEWGQRIAALVVRKPGTSLEAEAVRDFARASLRGSKTPDVVAFTDALPYTETGKLLRREVQADLIMRG